MSEESAYLLDPYEAEGVMMRVEEEVVSCRSVSKYFQRGKNSVCILNKLDLNIPKGIIFSLLGASGSGKTTLIKCIVGRMKVDEGSIRVLGCNTPHPNPNVGYMPQTTSLSPVLSMRQLLWLYGLVSGMDQKRLMDQSSMLIEMLKMTEHQNKPLFQLSGGQQRRVSFAVALLNEAPLLLLDEPTVGVDPLLRQSIWKHLLHLTRQGHVTVLITTHYIEEARHSHMVGLLQDGQLLAQDSPDHLLSLHSCSSLEDVFLSLSLHSNRRPINHPVKKSQRVCTSFLPKESCSFRRLKTLISKCHMEYSTYPLVLLFQILFPVLLVLLVPISANIKMPTVPLGVVNGEADSEGSLGSEFLNSLDTKSFTQIPFENYDTALKRAREGEAFGVIKIPTGFTQAVINKFLFPDVMNPETVNKSFVYITLDDNVHALADPIRLILMDFTSSFIKNYTQNLNIDKNLIEAPAPIQFLNDISGPVENGFQSFVAPGLILIVIFLFLISIMALSNVVAQTQGQFDRLYSSGVSSIEVIVSQLIYQFALASPVVALSMICTFYINALPCHGSYWLITLIYTMHAFAGICTGVMIGGISKNFYMAVLTLDFVYIVVMMLQGLVSPIEGMHPVLRQICFTGPIAYPVLAIRGIINHGWTITHPSVLIALGISGSWGIGSTLVAWVAFWLKK